MPEARWTELSSLAEWLPLCMCNASTAPGEPGPSYKQTNKKQTIQLPKINVKSYNCSVDNQNDLNSKLNITITVPTVN